MSIPHKAKPVVALLRSSPVFPAHASILLQSRCIFGLNFMDEQLITSLRHCTLQRNPFSFVTGRSSETTFLEADELAALAYAVYQSGWQNRGGRPRPGTRRRPFMYLEKSNDADNEVTLNEAGRACDYNSSQESEYSVCPSRTRAVFT